MCRYSSGPSRRSAAWMIAIVSRNRVCGRAHGAPYQPSTTCGPDRPRPMIVRLPPASASTVAIAIAVAVGVRALIWMMPVARRMREVLAARYASGLIASEP